jgi:Fe-S cluster assembly protein SufD
MKSIDKHTQKYLDLFKSGFNGEASQDFHGVREKAANAFADLGFPTTRQEEWRFTNIADIASSDFKIAGKDKLATITEKDIAPFKFDKWDGSELVFVDGFYVEQLSSIKTNTIKIESLATALENKTLAKSEIFTELANFSDEPFTALNTAFTRDGIIIQVPDNYIEKSGIHIIQVSVEENVMTCPRNVVIAGKSSESTVVETFHTLAKGAVFVNSVVEIGVAENAKLNHFKLQEESESSFHVGRTAIKQGANSNYYSASFDFGGKIVRNNISTELDGEGITSTLNGLYLARDTQHIDNHTFIDHAKPHCESHELYRGILAGKSKGVFSGKILVRQDAQKTDAKQSNNCLLLSDDAQIDAKPQLEIYADDVKCTHGATVGQLDDDALAYLRARGIPKEKAVHVLTHAFAEEVISGITVQPLQEKVEQLLLNRLQ